MPNKNIAYAILRTEPKRMMDLHKIGGHNSRTIAVPNADASVPNGARQLRLNGSLGNAYNAVAERIEKSGAPWPDEKNRYWAFEAVATFSPEADPMPDVEELERRGEKFFDDTWGRENVVAIWSHTDEKTPHLHALVVPVVKAVPPGRRKRGAKAEPTIRVSWQQFSGSANRNYRRPEKATTEAQRKRAEAPANEHNERMAEWQTKWAELWLDYGLRRGIPSRRRHLTSKWIRGQTGYVVGLANEARNEIADVANWFSLSEVDLLKFRQNPTNETLSALIATRLPAGVEKLIAPLQELAARGIQLDVERKARADLADEHEKLKETLAETRSAHGNAAAALTSLETENGALKAKLESHLSIAKAPTLVHVVKQIELLNEDDFTELVQSFLRQLTNAPEPEPGARSTLRPLPVPKPAKPGYTGPER